MKNINSYQNGFNHNQINTVDSLNPIAPTFDEVVSWSRNGKPASRYGDMILDLSGYGLNDKTVTLSYQFWDDGDVTEQRQNLLNEMRWIIYLLRKYKPELSVGTLSGYFTLLRSIANFCENSNCSFRDVLSSQNMALYWAIDHKRTTTYLNGLLQLLAHLDAKVVGYKVCGKKTLLQLIKIYREWVAARRQHPPIPTRIYSYVLATLINEVNVFLSVADSVTLLIKECIDNPLAGRSQSSHRRIAKRTGEQSKNAPDFTKLLQKYNLEKFWEQRGYQTSVKGLASMIAEARDVAALQIQAFSGMRAGEVESLPFFCLDEESNNGAKHYIIKGRTTKLSSGKVKRVQWITSSSGKQAIELAQKISIAFYSAFGDVPGKSNERINSHYLFVASVFSIKTFRNIPFQYNVFSKRDNLRAKLQPIIYEEDLQELERIDLHRAWRDESRFEVGKPWNLTTHQLRRSLALYAQRSGLVSIPSLKQQLQHITREMSYYYARGSTFAKNFILNDSSIKHFGHEWQNSEPISQYLSYLKNVILNDDHLFGSHFNWVDKTLRNEDGIILIDRESTFLKFKKGEMAYKETIIGGCVKTGPCNISPVDFLQVECLKSHCKNLVGSRVKLERVINVQAKHVFRLHEISAESSEYLQARSDLDVLVDTLKQLNEES